MTGFLPVSNDKQLSSYSSPPLMNTSHVFALFQFKRWVCPSPHSWTCCHLKWHTCLLNFVNHCLNGVKLSWNTGEKDRKKRSRKTKKKVMKKKMVGNCGYSIKSTTGYWDVMFSFVTAVIKPFPSSLVPLFHNESPYRTFHVKTNWFTWKWTCRGNSFSYEWFALPRSNLRCF